LTIWVEFERDEIALCPRFVEYSVRSPWDIEPLDIMSNIIGGNVLEPIVDIRPEKRAYCMFQSVSHVQCPACWRPSIQTTSESLDPWIVIEN
jgi:hypothetical protein